MYFNVITLTALILFFFFFFTTTTISTAVNSTAELTALLHLKSTLITSTPPSGENSNRFSTWLESETTPCSFTGVTCNPTTNSVISLDLSHHNLSLSSSTTSFLPLDRLCTDLTSLEKLAFGFNSLTGIISSGLSNCRNLTYLDLGNNAFTGEFPDDVFPSLTKLEHLHLNLSGLTGKFPWESLTSSSSLLQTLSIGDNSFDTTPFPTSITTNLLNLNWLYMSNCSISGSIPSTIGSLTKLTNLELSSNILTGQIPQSITSLTSLTQLELFDNSLTGPIPNNFHKLINLKFLDASHNSLSGTLTELSNLTNLISLQLYENHFTGSIPPEFGEFRNLVNLSLYTNNLSGEVPQSLGSWTFFDLLDISTNQFTGPIPPHMCKHQKMRKLLILQNQFSGSIPSEYGNCTSLTRFRVSQNSLTGTIPDGIWSLPNAEIIDVADNFFTGSISNKISNATKLGTLLTANNHLSGQLPSSISGATSLTKVDFRNNQLSSQIPSTIGLLTSLNTLYLTNNRFTGQIPDSLSNCRHLSDMNLAGNELSGSIPSSLGELASLNSLNLSSNHLSGQIPTSFTNLRLSLLDLSYNQLTGPVPDSLTISAYKTSYIGNSGLCTSNGNENNYLNPCVGSGSGGGGMEKRTFIICFVLGFVILVILTVLLSYLKLKKRGNRERSLKEDYDWDLKSYHILSFTEDEILDSVKPSNLIGKGGCGNVYRVTLRDGKSLAVKHIWTTPNPSSKSRRKEGDWRRRAKEFESEVGMLSSIRHMNVVKLFCSITSEDSSLLVYEYLTNGSLWDRLHVDDEKLGGIDWLTRYEIALGAGKGLEYLHHGCERAIVHRDIKSSNILLDEFLKPKIADFGLAKILQSTGNDSTTTSTHVVAGTHGYIAPEYGYTYKINEKSDVYSFGVVLMELVTGKKPIMDTSFADDLVSWVSSKLKTRESVLSLVDSSITEPSLREEAIKVLKIAILCTSRVPEHRPTMRSVVQMLVEADPCKLVVIDIDKQQEMMGVKNGGI